MVTIKNITNAFKLAVGFCSHPDYCTGLWTTSRDIKKHRQPGRTARLMVDLSVIHRRPGKKVSGRPYLTLITDKDRVSLMDSMHSCVAEKLLSYGIKGLELLPNQSAYAATKTAIVFTQFYGLQLLSDHQEAVALNVSRDYDIRQAIERHMRKTGQPPEEIQVTAFLPFTHHPPDKMPGLSYFSASGADGGESVRFLMATIQRRYKLAALFLYASSLAFSVLNLISSVQPDYSFFGLLTRPDIMTFILAGIKVKDYLLEKNRMRLVAEAITQIPGIKTAGNSNLSQVPSGKWN